MGLAFVPLYIQYLGIEAYGLIGLFAVLQAWLSLLDMGMTPTLSREMARFTGGAHSAQSIRDLLRSIELIAGGIALLIALGIWAASGWLASDWLRAEKLPTAVVAQAFAIMGMVTALRFVEGVYRSSIVGLQRQVLYNAVNSALATLRGLGAVGILMWVSPTIKVFFIWQGLISILTLGVLASVTYRALPKAERGGRFSMPALRGIWRFAGGMMGVTLLSLLLTQTDKIVLSKLLSLEEYGYYALAALVAGGLSILAGPINQAWYPRLNELKARNNNVEFARVYHQGAQIISVVVGGIAIVLIFYSEMVINIWTQNISIARKISYLTSILILGNLLNSIMTMPFYAQLANKWTSLINMINLISVLLFVPAIIWGVSRFGIEGAAWIWVCLNGMYILVGIHFMHRKILVKEKMKWYLNDVFLPLMASCVAVITVQKVSVALDLRNEPAILVVALFFSLLVAALMSHDIRKIILQIVTKLWLGNTVKTMP